MSFETSYGYQKVCQTGTFYPVGKTESEGYLNVVRTVCTLITVSIFSSWYNRRCIGRMMLLFLHWIAGLVHLLCGLAIATMILNCYIGEEFVPLIKTLKFLQLSASNLVAVTNLAICTNLALIVHSHRTMSRVKNVSSSRMVCFFIAISGGAAIPVATLPSKWAVTTTSFFSTGSPEDQKTLISYSYIMFEAVASFGMTVIVVLLLLFRRSEFREVWKLNTRIKFHVALTVIALLVDLFVAIGGLYFIIREGPFWLVTTAWILRYVHIALDTLVLYSALETPIFHLGRNLPECARAVVNLQSSIRC